MVGKEKFHRTAFYGVDNEQAAEVMLITNYPEYLSDNWQKEGDIYYGKVRELLSKAK